VPAFSSLLLIALLSLAAPSLGGAQATTENAEARVYFEEGNRLYQEASDAEGSRRTTLLQRSLGAYVDSLQIVRSRNALFNAAIVLGELERYHESFNYFSEYLAIEGLTEADRAEANRRRDELRGNVAVLEVISDPAGALVFVDRKDLAPRGQTPIELAILQGEHSLFFERDGFAPAELSRAAVRGETTRVEVVLEPVPVVPTVEPEPAPMPEARPRLRNAAIGTAAAALATAATALGVSLRARTLRDDANQASAQYRMTGDGADLQRAEDLADRTDRFNITADVLWGTTIALGVSALVLYGVHRKRQKRGAPEVGVSVSRHGGYASLKMAFGARP
jgi:hypothetical protein